ncbi:YbaK/EbsC family protein [Paenibacillus apiarius]|uniref:YbaK/EbsC family protein n=1 Tax=Paenibacillus apiarius TaxID=46240 RepID=UPI003B3A8056
MAELSDSTRTAQEAADAIGCQVAQIAKSIIFRIKASGKPLLVVASAINRIDEKKISKMLNEKLGKADADFVREHTGFVIGGVPPL